MAKKGVMPEAFLRFNFVSENNLILLTYIRSNGFIPNKVVLHQQLSSAQSMLRVSQFGGITNGKPSLPNNAILCPGVGVVWCRWVIG